MPESAALRIAATEPDEPAESEHAVVIADRDAFNYFASDILDKHGVWLLAIDRLVATESAVIALCSPVHRTRRSNEARRETAQTEFRTAWAVAIKATMEVGDDAAQKAASLLLRRVANVAFELAHEVLHLNGPIPKERWKRLWNQCGMVQWKLADPEILNQLEEAAVRGGGETKQYVTLDRVAARVNRKKGTLENWRRRKVNPLPPPDIRPGKGRGKANEWKWSKLRPWLEKECGRELPEVFPLL